MRGEARGEEVEGGEERGWGESVEEREELAGEREVAGD